MSQTYDDRVASSLNTGGAQTQIGPDQDASALLSLLDGTSPEAVLLAQGLTGNGFSLALLAATTWAEERDQDQAQQVQAPAVVPEVPESAMGGTLANAALGLAGGWLGSRIGSAAFGLPGALVGGVAGSVLMSSLGNALGLTGEAGSIGAETTGPETAPSPEVAAQEPVLDATPLPTKEQTREAMLGAYQTWLDARIAELADLSGDEKARRIEGLLDQSGRVYAQLEQGQMVDIDQLDTAPTSQGAQHVAGVAPPELIGTTRTLISQIEVDIDGATPDADAGAETSRTSGVDWNSRLGVPQYRNQNDNLVASFVTCNVTSGAMVMERLGYDRDDVQAATERELTEAWIIEQKAAWKDANGADMPSDQVDALRAQGPDDTWVQDRIAAYFEQAEAEAAASSTANYRQMRSGKDADLTGPEDVAARKEAAGQFMAGAQTEEMLDLLMQLHYENGGFKDAQGQSLIGENADLGAVRRSIAVEGVADEMLALLDPATAAAGTRTGCEQLSSGWTDAKPQIKACLDAGGAAQMSVMHKAQSDEGHLVSVQQITAGGVVIDDPYGRIGTGYDHDTTSAGTSAYKSAVSGASNAVDDDTPGVVDDDWTWQQGQQLDAAEQRGMSRTLPDSQISTMFKYVTLYHRPGKS